MLPPHNKNIYNYYNINMPCSQQNTFPCSFSYLFHVHCSYSFAMAFPCSFTMSFSCSFIFCQTVLLNNFKRIRFVYFVNLAHLQCCNYRITCYSKNYHLNVTRDRNNIRNVSCHHRIQQFFKNKVDSNSN